MTDVTHKSLPVAGYVDQPDHKVHQVNKNKELEERCLRRIEQFKAANVAFLDDHPAAGSQLPYDPRMLSLAFTAIQDAFMWLNRAAFQPSRVRLPEDVNLGCDYEESEEYKKSQIQVK